MRMSLLIGAVLAATVSTSVHAQPPTAPKLVVAISVDQFSADLFSEYRSTFGGGMRRLAGGVVFPSGYQSHAATETCPGHSTILTGDHPARTGVIANNWYDLSISRATVQIYCAEDPSASDGAAGNYVVSPVHLKVPTLGDRMKAADPRSRVVSVAGKDRAAVMMGGHDTDQLWYWMDREKAFVTLASRASAPRPAAIGPVNAHAAELLARDVTPVAPEGCRSRSMPIVSAQRTFGVIPPRLVDNLDGFKAGSELDDLTTDLAINLVRDLKLGQGPAPDLLAIGLSATDYVGHRYGTEGVEMCAQMADLDQNIGRILSALDATGAPYVVVLTADHGGHDAPERHDIHAAPDAQRINPALNLNAIGAAVGPAFGLKGQWLYGEGATGDVYLYGVRASIRPQVLAALKAKFLTFPQVQAVFTGAQLRATPAPRGPANEWTLIERFRTSFDPKRSGDLVVALKPNVTPLQPGGGSLATHGSPWNYDRRVPIVFYRPGMTGFEQPLPVETVDIAPSLAALIGLTIPAGDVDGRCLDIDAGAGDSCVRR